MGIDKNDNDALTTKKKDKWNGWEKDPSERVTFKQRSEPRICLYEWLKEGPSMQREQVMQKL